MGNPGSYTRIGCQGWSSQPWRLSFAQGDYERRLSELVAAKATAAQHPRPPAPTAGSLQALRVPLRIERDGRAYEVAGTGTIYIHGDQSDLKIRISDHSAASGMRHDADKPLIGKYFIRPLEGQGGARRN